MARQNNRVWDTPASPHFTWQHVEVELLMDIRDELRTLNTLLGCINFRRIPMTLNTIAANTKKVKRKVKP